jgi:hypothetical protein
MMDIGSIIDLQRRLPEGVTLKTGDILKVKVLEVFEYQRALVDLGRFRTLAEITFPVAAGDELRVQVSESGGRLRLQLAPASLDSAPATGGREGPVQTDAVEVLRQVRERIEGLTGTLRRLPDAQPLPIDIRRIADALRTFLAPLDPRSSPDVLTGRLKAFCEDSGMFLEHRLAATVLRAGSAAGERLETSAASTQTPERLLSTDLKSRLLFLKAFFEGAAGRELIRDNREIAELARTASEVLADIRGSQEQMAPPALVHMVHFALPLPGERDRAALKVAHGRRRTDAREQGHSAALLLELDRLGAVRADLTLRQSSLTVVIFVASTGLKDLVQRYASEIRDALTPFFDNINVKVSVSARKIAQFATEDGRSAGETRVDVRI